MKANQEIRDEIHFKKLKHWEVAEKIGITSSYFSVWLRTPLDEKRKHIVKSAINSLSEANDEILNY